MAESKIWVNSSSYDFPAIERPEKYYLICSTPRTGSTLLCRGLWDTSLAGAPHEYFHQKHMADFNVRWDTKNFEEYLSFLKKYRTSPNGVFGAKTHYDQFIYLQSQVDMSLAMPEVKYIYISRRDRVRQAVSLSKAILTKRWSSEGAVDSATPNPVYDFSHVHRGHRMILAQEANWEAFFAKQHIVPVRIIYEEFVGRYFEVIQEMLTYLGVGTISKEMIKAPQMKKQADLINAQWVEQYQADLARLNEPDRRSSIPTGA